MSFQFYSNAISRASRGFAAGIFVTGTMLVGFGFMIYLLPKFFATLAAIVFFVAGVSCGVTSIKIFFAIRKLEKLGSDDSPAYRNKVQVHIKEDFDD